LIACRLLERESGLADFSQRLLGDPRNANQVLPEESLLTRLESGELDAAFLYSTESAARRVPAVELPAAANLGNPALASSYASASVVVDGVTHKGAPIVYALTIPRRAPNPEGAATFVEFVLTGPGRTLLSKAGVQIVRPAFSGDKNAVPASLREPLGIADISAPR
jgi:molybdate/tungstate transport system substrate-binding protein